MRLDKLVMAAMEAVLAIHVAWFAVLVTRHADEPFEFVFAGLILAIAAVGAAPGLFYIIFRRES